VITMAPSRLLLASSLAFAVSWANAHHSVSAEFDQQLRVTLTGVISEIDWINPHTFVHLDVENDDGSVTKWRLESLPTAMMRAAGLSSVMLEGDGRAVTVIGIPARDGTADLAWLLRIDYQAGHHYQFGAVD